MKRKMSVLLALMLLLCSLFAVPVQAETVLKDGLEVTLTTDKESYDALETIYAKLTVKNTNDFAVQNVTTKISVPAGYTLDGDGEMQIGMLAAGEVLQQQISMRDKQAVEPTLPQTGDDSHGVLWSALFVVAAVVLCALMIRNPQTKRVISILLCVAIVAPYVLQAVPVQAEAHLAEIIVEKTVSVDGKPVVLTGVVSYEKPGMMLMSLRPFEIVTQPVSQTVSEGSRATFFIEVTGSDIQYQWYYKKPGSSTWTKSSNTTDTYSFTMKESYDGRSIRCKVKDANGETLTSDTVKLALPVAKITTQPKSQTVSAGSTAKFTVKATGDGLKYQWYYKKSGSSTWTKSSSTKATYSFTMKESYDGRSIRCKVTDQYGNTVTSNTVSLKLPVVKITTQPKSQTVDAGSTAKFTVAATGDGLKYQWYYKKSGSSTWTKSSSTKATYSFTMKESYDGRSIRCKVTDQYGNTATSNTVKLTLPAVKITTQPTDQAVRVGEKATFTVKAAGYGLTYQWYYKNAGASKWSKSSTGTTATYSFTMKESYDGRQVRCKVTDKNGNTVTSETAKLTLNESDYYYDVYNGEVEITHYIGNDVNVVIPSMIEGIPVTKLSSYSFSVDDRIKSIVIPNSVTSIGEAAFYYCTGLNNIEIPDSIEYIGERAFENCESLGCIELPNSIQSIGEWTFNGCISLSSIEIPDSVTSIGACAFRGCSSLKTVEIPNSVETIGENAFHDCTSLSSIEIPDSVTSIGYFSFQNCSNLSDIQISDNIANIDFGTFSGCSNLRRIVIPNSVISIDNYAFEHCSNLNAIEIPDSVTSIGDNAFSFCNNLTIYGVSGSYAETYAAENNIPFVAGDVPDNPAPSTDYVTVSGYKLNGASTEITVKEGDTLSFVGTVSASNGGSLTAVQASILLASNPEEGCKAVRKDDFTSNESTFDLSGFEEIKTGQEYYDPDKNQRITMEAGKSYIIMLYAADSNGVGFEDVNSNTPAHDGPYILVHVEAKEPEVTLVPEITKICDADGNALSTVSLDYLGTRSDKIYVYSNVGTITAWYNGSTNVEFDHEAANPLADGTYEHVFSVYGTKNATANKITSKFVFYAYTTDPSQPVKEALGTLSVTQGANPYRAIVNSVSLKDQNAKVFNSNNQLIVENGHHEGYTLVVDMNQDYLTDVFPDGQAAWYIYSSDPSTVFVYKKDDGKYYVQAKRAGTAQIYISHQYVDKYDVNTLEDKYYVCNVIIASARYRALICGTGTAVMNNEGEDAGLTFVKSLALQFTKNNYTGKDIELSSHYTVNETILFNEIENIADSGTERDITYVCLMSHGYSGGIALWNGKRTWNIIEKKWEFEYESLEYSVLFEKLSSIPGKIVYITGACNSASCIPYAQKYGDKFTVLAAANDGLSSWALEEKYVYQTAANVVFIDGLIESANCGDQNKDGVVTVKEAFDYAKTYADDAIRRYQAGEVLPPYREVAVDNSTPTDLVTMLERIEQTTHMESVKLMDSQFDGNEHYPLWGNIL